MIRIVITIITIVTIVIMTTKERRVTKQKVSKEHYLIMNTGGCSQIIITMNVSFSG